MQKTREQLSTEVSDLTARLATLERWERGRLVQARRELAAFKAKAPRPAVDPYMRQALNSFIHAWEGEMGYDAKLRNLVSRVR